MAYRMYILIISLLSSLGFVVHDSFWGLPSENMIASSTITYNALPSSAILPELKSSASPTSTELSITEEEFIAIAKKAYVWGWPLVYLHNCQNALQNLPYPARSGGIPVAPVNQLCMLTDYISPHATGVPCPNQDVIYGFGIFDLEQDAVVLQVPDFGDRFWLFQLGDHRTDGFARLGKMYNTQPGMYLVVGPNWQGEIPAGITSVLRCPTKLGYCIPRIHVENRQQITPELIQTLNQIVAYPLSDLSSEWKRYDWRKTRWLPKLASGSRQVSKWVKPSSFYEDLAEVMSSLPAQFGEEAWYREVEQLLSIARQDTYYQSILKRVANESESEIMAPLFDFRNVGHDLPYYWTSIENGAAFGRDFLTRASVAKSNIFVNRREETLYYYQDYDMHGHELNGGYAYQITFPAHQLPAVRGFWSLTVYNAHHAFHVNDENRYSLGSHSNDLRYNDDGSLTLYFQSTPPTPDWQSNWLPIPEGKFSLYLRAYWPEESMLNGEWCPPPVLKTSGNEADFGPLGI